MLQLEKCSAFTPMFCMPGNPAQNRRCNPAQNRYTHFYVGISIFFRLQSERLQIPVSAVICETTSHHDHHLSASHKRSLNRENNDATFIATLLHILLFPTILCLQSIEIYARNPSILMAHVLLTKMRRKSVIKCENDCQICFRHMFHVLTTPFHSIFDI